MERSAAEEVGLILSVKFTLIVSHGHSWRRVHQLALISVNFTLKSARFKC